MRLLAISMMIILLIVPAVMAEDKEEGPRIVERVIKIEGSVERPRVIFIVPKARLWKEDELEKSFRDEFLKAEYPVFKKINNK